MRKLVLVAVGVGLLSMVPVQAQAGEVTGETQAHWLAIAMAIAAAACGIAQSRAVAAGCEGVARNPGAVDTIRFIIILGLAFIEFLALLTFVVILIL